jgi:hypothetical protein
MEEYHAIKWVDENTATRYTKEVNLKCSILDNGKRIILEGVGDLQHHLIEDSAILMNKIMEVKCGH